MGKKKKRQRDSWDLTAEEQMELADAFYEAEKKGELLKLDKYGKASKFTENGLEPGIEEMIKKIENSYDIKKEKFNKNVLNNVTPKSVSILHDEKSEEDSVMVEFGDGEIKTKKLV